MTLAALWDGPYNIVYLLHILVVIAGTGAAFLLPVASARTISAGGSSDQIDQLTAAVLAPALLLTGVFGGALVGMSGDAYDFGQTWLAFGGLVWLVATAAAALAHPPSYLNIPDMSERQAIFNGVMHLSLAVMILLMVFKPGSPF